MAAFLVLRGAFFPRYGVSSLLGIAVLSEGFSACHACYQFLTGVPLVGLGFGEILEVVKLLRETLVHTFSGFRLEFTSREILRGRSATKQTPAPSAGSTCCFERRKGAIEHWNSPSTLGKPAHSSSGSVTERRAGIQSDQRRFDY